MSQKWNWKVGYDVLIDSEGEDEMHGKLKTVMFEVVDEAEFKKQWSIMCDSMMTGDSIGGGKVVAMSQRDEFSRIEQLEEELRK